MKFRFLAFIAFIFLFGSLPNASAQVDSLIGQITNSTSESFVSGISGDGRFAVIESTGNIATENPRNADGNREIFLFDYAQRRIFQITDTKSLLIDPTKSPTFDNIKVDMVNQRPVISNDGRWIAFSSNATCAFPGNPTANPPTTPIVSSTNPGNFNPNTTDAMFPCNRTSGTTVSSNLVNDGNTEMWLYEIPVYTPIADLSQGSEIPYENLSGGNFIRVTNTLPSRLPVSATSTSVAVIADDNRDASIDDTGSTIAFISNRDLVPCAATPTATCGNAYPDFDNPEVYTYVRNTNTLGQVTATPRGTVLAPIYNVNPNISGNGMRVSFLSNGDNPIVGMTGGMNSDRTDEIFYADLNGGGIPTGAKRQVTTTTATGAGAIINIFSYGKRMSRDGRFIAFESIADLTNENSGNNYTATAVFVFDANAPTTPASAPFRRVGPRADADAGVAQGDILRFPTFTDYDANGTPATVVLSTRLNITANGTIPATAADGLNPETARPPQVYRYSLVNPTFQRLTKFPAASIIANTQAYTSNSFRRIAFSLAQVELGTGNFDFLTETYYLLTPVVNNTTAANFNFATGASRIPVTASPVPTPSPTTTPTPSPSPTASPTPQTPPAVQGLAPGMLAIVNFDSGFIEPIPALNAVGSIKRSFQLPIELGGVTMSINGVAAGLKSISRREITFVVPPGLFAGTSGSTVFPFVINNNGTVLRGNVTIVTARPDIFTDLPSPGPGGRARAFNATNRVLTPEPFNVTTIKIKGGRRGPTVLRVYATGIFSPTLTAASYTIRIGSTTIVSSTTPVLREPGVYSLDFLLPAGLDMAGDQPIILTVNAGGQTYTSRLEDTAPRIRIL